MEKNMIVGRNLKLAREYLGLFRYQVAEILNISHDTVTAYEEGELEVSNEMMEAFARLYGVAATAFQHKHKEDMSKDERAIAEIIQWAKEIHQN